MTGTKGLGTSNSNPPALASGKHSALNEHRHFLSHSRGGDDEGAKRRAEARDRYLRDAGIEL